MNDSRNFEYPTEEYWTTEFWSTTSSWYNSTSSFTTGPTAEPRGDLDFRGGLEGVTFDLPDTTAQHVTTPQLTPTPQYVTAPQVEVSTSLRLTEPTWGPEGPPTGAIPHIAVELEEGTGKIELSKIMFGPFFLILLITTVILLYLILRHFRHLIRLYLSLVFYSCSQLFLFAVLIISGVLQTFVSLSGSCDAVNTVEFLALTLPGYGILLVSLARWMCVAYPTRYQQLLNLKVQVVVMVVLVCLLTLMTSLPTLGMCSNVWLENDNLKMGGMCHLEKQGWQCTAFRWILVSVGFILPFLGVIVVYCLIVNLLIKHKKKEKSLGKCKGSEKCGKVDYNYKPVTIGEKLSQLKAIGQDAIPWSIIMILILNTLTTLPWIPQIFAPELYFRKPISEYQALDLMHVVMLAAISFSPATYFLTTPVMRAEFVRMFSKNSGHKKFSVMSKNTDSTGVEV